MVKSLSMRSRAPEELSLNLTPLIDVVFLLLIFFMVTTTFKQNDQLSVELPLTQSPNAQQQMHGIELSIGPQGAYMIHGELIGTSVALLEGKLIEMFKQSQDETTPLYILGDKMAPYQSVVSAMDLARKIGITRIKIVTEYTEED